MYRIHVRNAEGQNEAVLLNITTVRHPVNPKVYCWTTKIEEGMQMEAEKAIAMHSEIIAKYGALGDIFTIEPVARSLADQLDTHRIAALASILGYKECGATFGETLKKTPPLPFGFCLRDAALAYIDALRDGLVAAAPEARK